MQVTQTSADGLKREFKVVISANDIREKVDTRLVELGRSVRVPGFRPGKVPPAVLRNRFGASVVNEVIEQAVSDSANQAMAEKGVRAALQPQIEITSFEEGSDLEYSMAVEILPDVQPADFSKMELERLVVEVGDAEVGQALERLAAQHKRSAPASAPRPAEKGDVLVIDFVGKVDGAEFAGGSAQDHHLELGSSAFVAGFEDQLIGAAPDDRVEVKITFPEEYVNDELAGKDAVFEVNVKEIREPVAVPVDDELAKMMGHETLGELKSSVREQIENQYGVVGRARLKRSLLDRLAEAHDFDVPGGMVDFEFDAIWQQLEETRSQTGLEGEDAEKTDDELRDEYRSIAERRVRLGLLLSEIGQSNNITVSQDEITRALLAEAQRHPGQEKQVLEYFQQNPDAMGSVRAPLFEEKVVDFILEMARVKDRAVTAEELVRDAEGEAEQPPEPKEKKKQAKGKSSGRAKKAGGKGGTGKKDQRVDPDPD